MLRVCPGHLAATKQTKGWNLITECGIPHATVHPFALTRGWNLKTGSNSSLTLQLHEICSLIKNGKNPT
ncbi:hypothetical protein SLEP1_g47264 [Rubroshorea leprosula]|uniref:Uncharacterized protein n=1 Tax=Rubroshorea leprosula TaxID=152421 RepID=A0AAV5LS34_9ROSI|nr:hypothetical protein SLEP1_g47264 [Rubroshorea leprosula]